MSGATVNDIPDCTIYCKSTQHGDIITASLSKRSISDFDLCAFLNYTCTRCESVRDSAGRTALHVAASCGRVEVVKWLICSRHADIEARDKESGYTALHRSIFYGKIHVAVELIKLGASVTELDLDNLTMLEHAMKDGLQPEINCGELYSWGSNNNNVLGPQQAREFPELLDMFHKEFPNEYVKQICIDQFHTVIITNSGKVFSCGHGQGGRLGLGIEHTVVTPKAVNFSDSLKGQDIITCVQASISRDHSIFVCSDGNIYTCGQNTYRVLGHQPPPEKLLIPKPVKHLANDVKGACAGRYHSVAWGPKSLYTWGLNAGQLGHKINNKTEEQYVTTPKKVKIINLEEVDIRTVAASDGATVVCTERGDIYVLHEYLCRKIASRLLNVIQIDISGGKIDAPFLGQELSKKHHHELKVIALTNTGNLFLWQESDPQLCRCIFSINRAIITRQVTININEILLVTDYGEAFKGHICPRKKKPTVSNSGVSKSNEKSAFHKFLEKEDCILVQLKKICKIHRAVSIQSDSKGKDFCIVQALPYTFFQFPKIIDSEMRNDLNTLLNDADECDNIHDIIFKIEHRIFPAHRYILSAKSPYFENLLYQNNEELISLTDVDPDIFEQFLLYVYTGFCDLTSCGELKNDILRNMCQKPNDIIDNKEAQENEIKITSDTSAYEYYKKTKHLQDRKTNSSQNSKNPLRLLQDLAKRFECKELQKMLSNMEIQKYNIRFKHDTRNFSVVPLVFDRAAFSNFHDVTVKCRDNKEIKAHKCILAARLEYFNNMFSMRWRGSETSEITLPFPKSIAEALLEFIYTDSLSYLNAIDIDHICKVLILADQLFVLRLKEQCELLLTNQLTLKNVVQLLSFADVYNAINLKYCCMKFIILNITALLELRSLDELENELLKELSDFYFQEKKEIGCRVITPYSTAPLDEEIVSVTSLYHFSLDDAVERQTVIKSSQKRKSRPHKTSLSDRNSLSCDNDTSLDNIIQFPDIPEIVIDPKKDLVNVPDRIKSITLASEKIRGEDVESQFTKLSSSRNSNSSNLSLSFKEENDFPELNSPPSNFANSFHHKTPPQKIDSKHKIVKLSQKQRKRLSSESNNVNPPVAESPKNPWKIIPDITNTPVSSAETKSSITEIISDERKQKENLAKITTKLLSLTQIEDRAIDELHKFYNSDNVNDEIIIIERVAIGAIASPVWVPRSK